MTGRGTVKLKMKANNVVNTLVLNDVALVLDLGVNLVSTGRLESQGLRIISENGRSSISSGDELVGVAVRTAENPFLYEMVHQRVDKVNTVKRINELVKSKKDWMLRHQRLGHLSSQYMTKLEASDIRISQTGEFCEECTIAKATKQPHKKKEQEKIEEERVSGLKKGVIHSDLMGPIEASLGGCRYILTYICSKTEYSTVYLLKEKSEQASFFKEYRADYEKQFDSKIKELRTDNGLEYLSNEFQDYLRQAGIRHRTSVAYTPQSNGKAERLNRTLLEKARPMLASANLNMNMWGSAILTANYLRNRSPCKPLNFKSPYEMRYNKLPALSHLRVFGCDAYPLIVNNTRRKFDPKALTNCVFVGYEDKDGIYRIYDKTNRKIFRSRDVKFNEMIKTVRFSNDTTSPEEWFTIDYNQVKTSEESLINGGNEETVELEDEINGEVNEEEHSNEHHVDVVENPPTGNQNVQTTGPVNSIPQRKSSRTSNKPERLMIKPGSKSYANRCKTYETPEKLVSKTYVVRSNPEEPNNYKEVLQSPEKNKWMDALKSELDSIKENNVWTVVTRPNDKSIIKTRWIFKIKRNANNEPEKYKARLVAKGYCQQYGIDYNETFAPVVKVQTLRIIFVIAAQKNLVVHQVDINTGFLNGDLDGQVFIELPPGIDTFKKDEDCNLLKALYRLKQAP